MFYPIITTLDGGGGRGRISKKLQTYTDAGPDAGSQLTFEMGEGGGAGITEKRH